MPDATAAQGAPQQPQRGFSWRSIIMNMIMMWLLVRYLTGSNTNTPVQNTSGETPGPLTNLWIDGQKLEMRLFISEMATFPKSDEQVWHLTGLSYDYSSDNDRSQDISVKLSKAVQHNATLYAHVFVTREGFGYNPSADGYDSTATIHSVHEMVKYMKRPKVNAFKNLISGETEIAPQPETTTPENDIISFWNPNITINLVHDFTAYPQGGLPPHVSKVLEVHKDRNQYYPVIFFNEFWLLKEHLIPINETTPELPLHMSFNVLSFLKWTMYEQMSQSLEMQLSLGSQDSEIDDIKRMLLETNPYLLGVTMVVSLLHMVFDFLAFKNDISFWKNNKSLEGLSVKSIVLNTVMQFIVFLYLLDNETSWMILLSVGIGLLIEIWKLRKAVDMEVYLWKGIVPWIKLHDKASYVSRTKEFDDIAMTYLGYALFPLLIAYAIYSLIYETHKSWYSFILSTLTGAVYTFGFIMMTPQLFINYKLRSVAHLPWRTFMYKALNTFIDDLFAFIIKMPTLHRLSCFRDDLVFVIYLYQRWKYPVDKTRANEYGQVAAEAADADANATAVADTITDDNAPATTAQPKRAEEKKND